MDNVREDINCAEIEMEVQGTMDVGSIFRCIFSSCDDNHTDLVSVSKLIEFVKPYMSEDLNALEDLRHSLDPEGKDGLVNSERFYEVMNLWIKKVTATSSNEENAFDGSPSRLQVIDEKQLPYAHSTPRASIGDKLLKCKDLLNLSNVSGYSLSNSRLDTTNPVDSDKTVLEEAIKKLEHQLSKTASELTITKQQLTASEEQNDTLQQDLDKLNRRIHAEQQVNEHLQREQVLSEELRDELNTCKKVIEEVKKKLSQSEKDSMYYKDLLDEKEQEQLKHEKKIGVLSKQHQDCLKEIFDLKTETETKEQQLADVVKFYDELKLKFAEQKDFTDQLREENDILNHQKSTLEKALKVKSFNSPHSSLGNLNLHISSTPSPHCNTQNTYIPRYSPSLAHQSGTQPKCHSVPLLRRVLAPVDLLNSLWDSSSPESVKCTLSPVRGTVSEGEQREDSSEEDLYWKLQQGADSQIEGQGLNGTTESLHTEMHRADPIITNETYHTILFEKDEQIVELEDELEKVKTYLKEIEDQKDDVLTKLKENIKLNDQLIKSNFILEAKLRESEEANLPKIESLKKKLAQLDKNGVIVENDHETVQGEIEELKSKIKILEEGIESAEIKVKKLTSVNEIKSESLLKKEVAELQQELRSSEIVREDYHKGLQVAMNDLGKPSMEKLNVEEQIKALDTEKQNLDKKDLEKKLKFEESFKIIRDMNKQLENENLVLRQDLECLKAKYEHLSKQFGITEEELREVKDSNNNMSQELTRSEDEKKVMSYKFEKMLRIQTEEIKYLKDLKDQMNGDKEEILNLTKKCTQLQNGLKNNLSMLSSTSRNLIESDNTTKYLSELEISLKEEIESLKSSNAELVLSVANLKSERENLLVKLQTVNKIEGVASEIQKHIKDNYVIEELKQINKKLEYHLIGAETDLKKKVQEILVLRNEWSKNVDIKNDLWNRLKLLQKENYRINAENNALLEKERQLSKSSDELNIEYNNLLIIYDLEVNKNSKLNEQISQFIEEKNQYCIKYSDLKKRFDIIGAENQELREKLAHVQRNDSTCQTDSEPFDETFSKIKLESDKLLEELESKVNEEVNKNRDLTKDLLDLKGHLDHRNNDLLEMRQKITNNETDMLSKLQQSIENNKKLTRDLSRVKEILQAKEVDLRKLLDRVNEADNELKLIKEQNVMLNQELAVKCKELENMQQRTKDNEEKMQIEIQVKNTKLLKKLTDVESLLEQRQKEMRSVENNNRELASALNLSKQEKDKLNNELFEKEKTNETLNNKLQESASKLIQLSKKLSEQEKINVTLNTKIQEGASEINQLSEKLSEQEKINVTLNTNVQEGAFEIIQLSEKLSEKERINETLIYKLQKAAFEVIQLQEKLSEYEKKSDAVNSKIQEASTEIIQLQEKLSEKVKTTNALHNKLQEASSEKVQLLEKLSEKEQTNETLNNKFQEAAAEINQLQDKLSENEAASDALNKKLHETSSELIQLQEKMSEKEKTIENMNNKLQEAASEINQLQEKLSENKAASYALNNKLQETASELIQLQKKLSDNENFRNKLLNETKQRLQEEIAKNKALFENFSLLKQERDQLTSELNDTKASLNDIKSLYNKRQSDIKDLLEKCSELDSKVQIQAEQLKKFEDEINKTNLEKCVTNVATEKETSKRKTYSRQQITIDKLKDKLEEEKVKNLQLQGQLTAKEKMFEEMEKKYMEKINEITMSPEGNDVTGSEAAKTINKFTLAARSTASPDSPSTDVEVNGIDATRKLSFHTKCPFVINCDSTIEIPSLDVNGFADDIIEELELTDGSPRKKLDREETEKNVTALTLRLLVNSNDISERIENQTEKYRCQYEEILNLIRDISHRLRDHVCIGTAEPIMPVFVLLEDIKLQLKEVVQTAGQVGVLIYEDRMKRCWNLTTNYMAMLRQENESLLNISRETTPTQTGLRRRNKFTHEKVDLPEKKHYRRKLISCSRLTAILLFVLMFALTISLIIHLNCRMTASENQYCPLDGIITRINVGVPPM